MTADRTCRTCAHFEPWFAPWGRCGYIQKHDIDVDEQTQSVRVYLAPSPGWSWNDQESAWLYVRNDFGCVEHEPKAPPPPAGGGGSTEIIAIAAAVVLVLVIAVVSWLSPHTTPDDGMSDLGVVEWE